MLIPIAYSIEECQRVMTPQKANNCTILSTWKPADCNLPLYVYNSSSNLVETLTWQNNSILCEVTWNITKIGVYPYNSSIETGIITIRSDDNMIWLLFIPLALCFLFIYWANSLSEEHEPLKWFMRLLSLIMIFTIFVGANIIINLNPGYEGLLSLFNIVALQWIVYTIIFVFIVFFVYRIFIAFKMKKKNDFENGILR